MSEQTKILIVEDDKDLVAALQIVLQKRGFDVVAAYDAPGGLAKAEEARPDLIVLDIMMPDATEGFHFVWTLRLREEEYFRTVPIIVISAIHQRTELRFYPDSADGTYQAGEFLPVQGFIDKPVDPAELLREVERQLGLARGGER
ncbi:MAG: response regulator [Gemmatimonadota bacterium]|nr:MAG: response regulator [Gemmatimonadota bacterium]